MVSINGSRSATHPPSATWTAPKAMKGLYHDGKEHSIQEKLPTAHDRPSVAHEIDRMAFSSPCDGDIPLCEICDILTRPPLYRACWIILTGPAGPAVHRVAHRGFGRAGMEDNLRENSSITAFVSDELARCEDVIIDRDPARAFLAQGEADPHTAVHSLTAGISFRSGFYGAISLITASPNPPDAGDRALILEIARIIAFRIHERKMAATHREMDEMINSLWKNYRTTFETTGTATILTDEDTLISLANTEFEKLSGYAKGEIEDRKSWTEFIVEEDLEMMKEYHRMRRIDPTFAPRNYGIRFIDRKSRVRDIYMTVGLIPGTKKSILSFLDVTEQKRLENEILRISEEERRKIGNNLHDGLGPHLVGIKFMLNLHRQKLERIGVAEAGDVAEINSLLDQAITQTRMMVKGLCPVDIDAEGLIFALQELAAQVESVFSVQCRLVCDESITFSDNVMATQIYYIVQEAINNAIKHARPGRIDIIFNRKIGTITLSIDDNGAGFSRSAGRPGGMGISIMKYRARMINAILDVIRNHTGGTSVICILKK